MKKLSIAFVASPLVATSLLRRRLRSSARLISAFAGRLPVPTVLEKYRGSIAPAEEELASAQQKLQEMQEKGKELEAKKDNPALRTRPRPKPSCCSLAGQFS